jgi:hypothetical protein
MNSAEFEDTYWSHARLDNARARIDYDVRALVSLAETHRVATTCLDLFCGPISHGARIAGYGWDSLLVDSHLAHLKSAVCFDAGLGSIETLQGHIPNCLPQRQFGMVLAMWNSLGFENDEGGISAVLKASWQRVARPGLLVFQTPSPPKTRLSVKLKTGRDGVPCIRVTWRQKRQTHWHLDFLLMGWIPRVYICHQELICRDQMLKMLARLGVEQASYRLLGGRDTFVAYRR